MPKKLQAKKAVKSKPAIQKPEQIVKPPVKINKIQTRKIDATDRVLGRLATETAIILRGKDKPSFKPYMISGDKVIIINAAKIVLTGNKLEQKVYQRHTGYLGHLKTTTAKELMVKNPAEILRRAIFGMLPKNKLRDDLMKNLTIVN